MKQRLLSMLVLLACMMAASAQELKVNEKFGKPADWELNMKTYSPDPEAPAVVLYSSTYVDYDFNAGIRVKYEYKKRIKILKEEGKEYATVEIVYYNPESNSAAHEQITGLKAVAYNMEGGNVVKTKMEKSAVFKERLDEKREKIKFAVPQVKVGTVVEISYGKYSDYYFNLDTWYAQEEIPVLYADYDFRVPEWFRFKVDQTGPDAMKCKQEGTSQNIFLGGDSYSVLMQKYVYKAHNLKGIEDDGYVWNATDYADKVEVEMSGISVPGQVYESFIHTWDEVAVTLMDADNFGGRLKNNNPLKNEMTAAGIMNIANPVERITAIYLLLKSKVKWNNTYAFYGVSGNKMLKDRVANNATINFVLINMLRDAGIKAYPVVMSTRSHGRLPLTHPSLESLNTFVVAAKVNDSTAVYLDGSVEDGCINVLPENLLPSMAYMIYTEKPVSAVGVNLSSTAHTQINVNNQLDVKADGTMEGNSLITYSNHAASNERHKFRTAKDSATFVNNFADGYGIKVSECSYEDKDNFTPVLKKRVKYTKSCDATAENIYVNGIVFPYVRENPFKAESRTLPVEFSSRKVMSQKVLINIPEGYSVAELPKNSAFATEDKGVVCQVKYAKLNEKSVLVQYSVVQKRMFFSADMYSTLRQVFDAIAQRGNDMIVLKKN